MALVRRWWTHVTRAGVSSIARAPAIWLLPLLTASCGVSGSPPSVAELPLETGLVFANLSKESYAALAIRAHAPDGTGGDYFVTPLLPPGATYRQRFFDAVGEACPEAVDLRVWLYRRANDDVPIGLDPGEEVEPVPLAAGEVLGLPACAVQPVEYTVVSWEAPDGQGRVKVGQGTPIEEAIRAAGLFPNVDATWEIDGVSAGLDDVPPPPAPRQTMAGRVVLADGTAADGVGVLIRTRFRLRLTDDDPSNDPDAGFGEPIDFTTTAADGSFSFDRPPGAYRVEFFSDDWAFRPAIIDVEAPIGAILTVAEPL